ncbi:MAG: hypothetical protein Q9211_006264, partial [Gyalolechia sp. 1 TL-2023]
MSLNGVNGAGKLPFSSLTAHFPSNNPFRNRGTSPASHHSLPSPQTATFNIPDRAPERPTSRNPFLDQNSQPSAASPPQTLSAPGERMSPTKPTFTGHTAELFDNLSLNDKSGNAGPRPLAGPTPDYRPSRPENVPPGAQRRPAPPVHRPSRSEEEQRHLRNPSRSRGPPQTLDIFADPPQSRTHRLRRNSDSSLASRTLGSEEERRRRERRHKEREARKNGKPRPYGTSSKSKKPNQKLDIIDSLDVTSIYGTG